MSIMKLFAYLEEYKQLPPLRLPVVELGCNDGRILMPFYVAGYEVIGVDMDFTAIQLARAAMPNGNFHMGDISDFPVPQESFVIMRNVLPFLASKEDVMNLLRKLKNHPMHFTLFGELDERPRGCLWWTCEEVETICAEIGATIVEEFNGESKNMAGKPRRTHNFYCLKV